MEFKNADDAAYAMAAMNGHPFDAKHTFWVNRFIDVEKYTTLDETWVEPEPEPYKPKVRLVWYSPYSPLIRLFKGTSASLVG